MSHRNLLAVTLVSVCALSSLSVGAQPNPPGFPTQPKFSKLMQLYIDIFNAHEFDRFDEIFSEDYLLVSTAGTFQGRDNVAALMEGFVDAFPDLTYTFEEILVDGNNVVIRYSWSGTNTGSFMGMPPSYNEVSCTGLEIDRIADGRIVETQNFTDMHCLLTSITPTP